MVSRAFEVGDRVRVMGVNDAVGIVRSIDKSRRRTDPFYIYFVELSGEEKLIDFEFRELELIDPDGPTPKN